MLFDGQCQSKNQVLGQLLPFCPNFRQQNALGRPRLTVLAVLPSVYADFEPHVKGSEPALNAVETETRICNALFPRCVLGRLD